MYGKVTSTNDLLIAYPGGRTFQKEMAVSAKGMRLAHSWQVRKIKRSLRSPWMVQVVKVLGCQPHGLEYT